MTWNWMIGLKLLMGEVEEEAATGKKMKVCLGYRVVNELNSSHEGITVVQTGISNHLTPVLCSLLGAGG